MDLSHPQGKTTQEKTQAFVGDLSKTQGGVAGQGQSGWQPGQEGSYGGQGVGAQGVGGQGYGGQGIAGQGQGGALYHTTVETETVRPAGQYQTQQQEGQWQGQQGGQWQGQQGTHGVHGTHGGQGVSGIPVGVGHGAHSKVDKQALAEKRHQQRDAATLKTHLEQVTGLLDRHSVFMLTTVDESGKIEARPMRVASRINNVDFLLFSNRDTTKIDQISKQPHVCLSFYDQVTSEWMCVSGKVSLSTDKKLIGANYHESVRGWLGDRGDGIHDGGPQDPRLALLCVETSCIKYAPRLGQTTLGAVARRAKEALFHSDDMTLQEIWLNPEEIDRMRITSL